MLTNIYECLAITVRSWRSLCDHCELMANGIRKPTLHTFATGETSITFETPQKRPRMLTNRYECLAIICDHYEFMANCIRKPIRHIFATVRDQHQAQLIPPHCMHLRPRATSSYLYRLYRPGPHPLQHSSAKVDRPYALFFFSLRFSSSLCAPI